MNTVKTRLDSVRLLVSSPTHYATRLALKREVCPPAFQDVFHHASKEVNWEETESSVGNGSKETTPPPEENPPMIEGKSLF